MKINKIKRKSLVIELLFEIKIIMKWSQMKTMIKNIIKALKKKSELRTTKPTKVTQELGNIVTKKKQQKIRSRVRTKWLRRVIEKLNG